MWNIRPIYSKSRGFTLIEIILALAITSMIILPMFTLLDFSIKSCDKGEQKDDLILNGRYGIEYIKDEIRMADRIISSEKIENLNVAYPTNIGFVIMIKEENGDYKYITYHIKDTKLIRLASTRITDQYPTYNNFSGHNTICEFIDSIEESKFDPDQSTIYLDFRLKHRNEDLKLKSDIYIRCPMDF